jgi:hypothetical protein
MKKIVSIVVFLFVLAPILLAQPVTKLKKTITLTMPGVQGDNGTNGASVAYHPIQKKYYAAMAGNESYPMVVFDAKGKQLSADDVTTGFDVRGLWYNSKTKSIEANGYYDYGWTKFNLDSKGIPAGNTPIFSGQHQPTDQVVGSFDAKNNCVYFLDGAYVLVYDYKTGEKKELDKPTEETMYKNYLLSIKRDATTEEEASYNYLLPEKYNNSLVVFTEMPKAEFGLLNTETKQIELYDRATGNLTKALQLPDDAICSTMFNFSYANKQFWLFDIDNRTWIGYK